MGKPTDPTFSILRTLTSIPKVKRVNAIKQNDQLTIFQIFTEDEKAFIELGLNPERSEFVSIRLVQDGPFGSDLSEAKYTTEQMALIVLLKWQFDETKLGYSIYKLLGIEYLSNLKERK